MGYYLTNGIFPRWPVFVMMIRHPVGLKKAYFVQHHEGARKDVERAFGPAAERWASDDGASSSHGVATAPLQMGVPRSNEYLLQAFTDMRREGEHLALQADMVEELWARRGAGTP
ncbi:uncharacterized protein LOC121804173 [Salvia splendens]|uniref:uncharacterized protein LOC121804173 n=1 Tax=Salvia splendens TaxID=180675 RepID=UPI001C27A0A7|nr:uncharacterized protein LOC121804173 [Salvia splendens]